MKVLIITQYFPPEIGAAASRWGDYSRILSKNNHDVTVLCEVPNYPSGKIFENFKNQIIQKEHINSNLKIIRSLSFPTNRKGKIKKLLHYLIFMISGIFNLRKIKNYDLIIVSTPPLFVGVIGLYLSKYKSMQYWLDIRDLWPDSALALNQIKKGTIYKLGKKLEKVIYENSQGYIFAVPDFKDYFETNFPKINKPIFNLLNGVDKRFLKNLSEQNFQRDEVFTVLFSGNIGLAQSLETLIKSAEELKNYPIYFKLVGNGVKADYLKTLIKKRKLTNVSISPSVDRKKLIQIILKSSVCVSLLSAKELFKNALPSKIFEYMACKRPVICNYGSAGNLVDLNKAGTVIKPEDSKELSSAILKYFNEPNLIATHGISGFSYVKKHLAKEDLIGELMRNFENN